MAGVVATIEDACLVLSRAQFPTARIKRPLLSSAKAGLTVNACPLSRRIVRAGVLDYTPPLLPAAVDIGGESKIVMTSGAKDVPRHVTVAIWGRREVGEIDLS